MDSNVLQVMQVLQVLHDDRINSVAVSSGNTPQMSQAVFLPLPAKKKTVSQPVRAWNMGKTKALSRPNAAAMVWTAMFCRCFPVPYATQSSSAGILLTMDTAKTTTSVSLVLIIILQ